MKRLMIKNTTHKVEFPDTPAGMMQIKAFRKSHQEFKGRRIKAILQLLPSAVPCGDIIEMGR